ncbi:MAG TPA: phosphatidylserine decarboxylase, partial [Gemmatimonadales bacterium]
MRIAPEGRPFIIGAAAIGLVLVAIGWTTTALLWAVVAVWVVAFFRDPMPRGRLDDAILLAPADGKVVSIIETDEPAFLGDRAIRISIFMNVFDGHVNRYPCAGTVAYRHYNPGSFGHAGTEKASLSNEQSSVGLETPRGRVLIRQIAGLVARRIVTDHAEGTEVKQAQRLGMIRFGSRVDLFLPRGSSVRVRVGD